MARADVYELLCERCGYSLEQIRGERACPECGKPVSESLPERRRGTAWQRRRAFWQASHQSITRPRRTLDELDPSGFVNDNRLWRLHHGLASLLGAIATTGAFAAGSLMMPLDAVLMAPAKSDAWDESQKSESFIFAYEDFVFGALIASLTFLVVRFAISMLSVIEMNGLRLIAKTRGWRVDKDLAHAIVAHGAVGWWVGMIGPAIFYPLAVLAHQNAWYFDGLPRPFWYQWAVYGLVGTVWALAGFMAFELFAYIGVRRCRYANRVRPDNEQENNADV